jgi:hypothetical protein
MAQQAAAVLAAGQGSCGPLKRLAAARAASPGRALISAPQCSAVGLVRAARTRDHKAALVQRRALDLGGELLPDVVAQARAQELGVHRDGALQLLLKENHGCAAPARSPRLSERVPAR